MNIPVLVLEELKKHPLDRVERFFLAAQRIEFLKVLRSVITIPGILPKFQMAWGQLFPIALSV